MKRRNHSGKGMIRKTRVIGNDLDAAIRIISLAIVQSLHETKIKTRLLEVVRAIAKMKPRTNSTMIFISWLNRQMSLLEVTAVKVVLLVQKLLLLVFRVNAAGTKLQLLKDYNCRKDKDCSEKR
ncbi:hypothetical protein Tco_0750734 [Tanacetum coccineum]|uniref:Ribosomal protein L22 n=1 Tax=Tanacetum coccineum TaxID=301880 RepID=A0ABQ4Z1Z7_9ASTR